MQQTTGRLPVNPRRHKVAPENRKRVARACNSCNVRRIKCSGEKPCRQCSSGERECVYPSVEPTKTATLKEENEKLKKRLAALEKSLQVAVPDEIARQELVQQIENAESPGQHRSLSLPTSDTSCTTDEADAATEGRLLYDFNGNYRFFGETSGATFLDLLKHFMLTLVPLAFVPGPGHTTAEDGSRFVASIGHYQTDDSTPMIIRNLEVDPLWLPSRTDMTSMLTALGYHIQHGNGEFSSGGIYYWGDLDTVPSAITFSPPHVDEEIRFGNYRHLAFHNICFAFATHVLNYAPSHDEENAGDRYFKRAQMLLGNPLDAVRFTVRDIPTLALMGFYLVEINRRDSAYMFVSLAVHVAIVYGAFRHCADESSRRVLWTLYVLDRWLSCLLGRPPSLMDESIRIPLPADAPNLPPAAGLRAHVEFCRVSGFIVCETFRIAPRNPPSQFTANINLALCKLQQWRRELPPILQLDLEKFSVDPGTCTMHMAYYQLTLLTTRPIFFNAVKRAVAERYIQSGWSLESDPQYTQIHTCSSAASANIRIFRFISQHQKHNRVLQASLHIVFNAAVILMLNRILHACPNAVDAEIQFAMDLFSTESRTGRNYQRDCLQMLRDLKVIVGRFLMTATGPLDLFQQGFAGQPVEGSLQPHAPYENGNGNGNGNGTGNGSAASTPLRMGRNGQGSAPATGELIYQELVTWTQMDSSQLHSTFKI